MAEEYTVMQTALVEKRNPTCAEAEEQEPPAVQQVEYSYQQEEDQQTHLQKWHCEKHCSISLRDSSPHLEHVQRCQDCLQVLPLCADGYHKHFLHLHMHAALSATIHTMVCP